VVINTQAFIRGIAAALLWLLFLAACVLVGPLFMALLSYLW